MGVFISVVHTREATDRERKTFVLFFSSFFLFSRRQRSPWSLSLALSFSRALFPAVTIMARFFLQHYNTSSQNQVEEHNKRPTKPETFFETELVARTPSKSCIIGRADEEAGVMMDDRRDESDWPLCFFGENVSVLVPPPPPTPIPPTSRP